VRSRGFEHGGTVLPFHRNQTVIAYDSAKIAEPPSGLVEIFDYAKAHDLKVAVTNPTKGGSGSGFVESALLALAPECKRSLRLHPVGGSGRRPWRSAACRKSSASSRSARG
jgi:ABC-type uncharacterized transport system, periplasmic component